MGDGRTRKPRLCWTSVAMLVTILAFGLAQDTRTASFYGGFHQEAITPNEHEDAVHISLSFRTLQESGLLFFINSSRGYIAVLLHHSNQLQVVHRLDMDMSIVGYINTTDSSSEDSRFGAMLDWRTVGFRLTNRTLHIQLEQGTSLNHTFLEPVEVQSVSFGGPESFFTPLFMHLSSPHYFVGCMKDISIDSRDILIDSERYGISAGCCSVPRYSALCLTSTLTNLPFRVPSTYEDVDTLMVTFHVQLNSDGGVVLLVNTQDTALALLLETGRLQLLANASGRVSRLDCPGDFLVLGEWHRVELLFSPSRMSCAVNGVPSVAVTFSPALAWTSLLLRLGGIDLPPNLVQALSESQNSFLGCYRKLRLNGADIDPSLFSNATHARAANQPSLTNWSHLYSNFSELVVIERTAERLSTDTIVLFIPQDQYGDELTALYQREVENTIHFEATLGPLYGHLFMGNHSASVESFQYHNLVSDEPSKQVGYLHSGGENSTDVVVFRVWAGCSDQVLADIQLALFITIEGRDDAPRMTSSLSLNLAVGTRRTITADVLRVEDQVVSDPSLVLFFVRVVAVQDSNCSSCMEDVCVNCPDAGAIFRRGTKVKFFTQDDVNQGIVQFQHWAAFLAAPLIARFGVTVQERLNGNIDASFMIFPRPGRLSLMSNPYSCLFVIMGGVALVKSKHLTAVTDFEDQSPTITYDLLITPVAGVVQVWSPHYQQWLELSNSTHSSPSLLPTSSFTQADVYAGWVKYIQSEFENQGLDHFTFQLRSSNLSGPTGVLCINILPEPYFDQPTISIHMVPLAVARENSSATITGAVLNTTLDNVDYLEQDPDYEVDVQQLGIVYTLVEAPSYGSLERGGVVLVAGDNFTYNDIASRLLVYNHAGTEHHQDSFIFYAQASSTAYLPIKMPNLTANLTLSINITATNNYPPVLKVVEEIHPYEGSWVAVTIANVNATDRDRPPSPLKIMLRSRREEPFGMFVLRSSPTQSIKQFYMQDVLDNNVLYVHRLNSHAELRFRQGIRIKHINSFVRTRLFIEAIPLDLAAAVSLLPNSSCIASLDAEQGPLKFNFNSSMFSVVLSDRHGNDINLIPNITVSINSTTHHGQISKQTRVMLSQLIPVPVSQFQFQEVNNIWYDLNNNSYQTEDWLDLEFSYGHSVPVLLSLRVCIRPLLVPLRIQVSQMILTHGGMGHITMEHLSVTSSRPGDDGALLFHVREDPRYGSLTDIMSDSGVGMLSQFTLAQLRSEVVVYDHYDHTSAEEDQIHFQVCSEVDCLDEVVLSIQIVLMNMTVNNSIVRVLEGSKYVFSLTDFNVVAAPGFTSIKIITKRPPLHGVVKINTSAGSIIPANYFDLMDIHRGRFFYMNDGEENIHDNFVVRVEAENPDTDAVQILEFIMWIEIEPVNDWSPEVVSGGGGPLVVVEGGSVLITSQYLSAHDYDSHNNDDDLVWTLPKPLPLFGYIYLDHDPGFKNLTININEWTEGDIKNDRLHYRNVPDGDFPLDFLIITVSDGDKVAVTNLIVQILAVNIEQDGTVDFSLDEGESKRISYQHLHYTAVNDEMLNNTDFLITIKHTPSHGQLLLGGTNLYGNSSFMQDQIGRGQLVYVHDHSNTFSDNFTMVVSVPTRKNGAKEFFFHITIHLLNDDPPVVFIHNRLFVVELEMVLINSTIMTIVDRDAKGVKDDDLITCKLVEKLRSGRLEKQRFSRHIDYTENFTKFDLESGKLWYKHLSSPDLHPDNMIFNITDGINHQPQIYNLSIIILPLIVPVTLKALTVTENERAEITTEELLVAHDFLSTIKGVITVLEDSGPRHGDLVNRITGQSVQSFSTEDIANGSIFYHHNGDENEMDSFLFVYEALDPAGYNRRSNNETFSVIIFPVDDLPPVVNNNVTLRLWANETVLLTETEFNVTDNDTSPSKLNFTVDITRVEMYVAYISDTSNFILWFTQEELRARRVVVVHKDGPKGAIEYNVTDGKHWAQGFVTIIADLLSLECKTDEWRIEVNYLEAVELSTSNIHCLTTDDDNPREITYTFPQNLLLGHFEMDSLMVTSFNSTALRGGLVRYVHTETGYWLERETLNVSASSHPASPRHGLPLLVYVQYPQPPPNSEVAVNRKVNLTEGGSHCLSASALDARNLRYRLWLQLDSFAVSPGDLEVLYRVVKGPTHGNLTRYGVESSAFTQRDLNNVSAVCYTHDDSETTEDAISLDVQVILANGTALPNVYREQLLLQITPRNDQQPVLVTNYTKMVVENFTSSLLALDLQLKDGDSLPHQLIFHLISIPRRNVYLLLNGSVMSANSSFSQADIDRRQVTLQPYHVGFGSFQFMYTDGVHVSPDVIEFRVTVEVHTLTLLHNNDITYMQQNSRHTIVITSTHIDTRTNALTSQTVFALVHTPMHGYIQMGNTEVHVFTQEEVNSEQVYYLPHAGTQHHSDNFTLNVTNNNITLPLVEMKVRILVRGQVKEHIFIDFSGNPPLLASPLPRDVLVLNELQMTVNTLPTIKLEKKPRFGHLEMRVKSSNTRYEISSIRYEDLQQGWIAYVWDFTESLTNITVNDSIEFLVLAEGYQPGEAVINLTINVPQGLTSSNPSAHPSSSVSVSSLVPVTGPLSTTNDTGFPVYTLVPILGTILFLVVLIVVVMVFCLTQQKHIKLKLVPRGTHRTHHQSPCPALHPGPVMPYELDPSGILPGEEQHYSSETSSGFSEPDISLHETSTQSYTTHHHHPSPCPSGYRHPPTPPRSRMRSNVSITFSSQHSTTSELGFEDEGDRTHNPNSLSLPRYVAQTFATVTSQLPVRPASHTAVSWPGVAVDDGGSDSGRGHQGEREELAKQQQGASQHHHHVRGQTESECLEEEKEDWTQGTVLPDFDDHLRNLFHPVNPVLKKEEYWV